MKFEALLDLESIVTVKFSTENLIQATVNGPIAETSYHYLGLSDINTENFLSLLASSIPIKGPGRWIWGPITIREGAPGTYNITFNTEEIGKLLASTRSWTNE